MSKNNLLEIEKLYSKNLEDFGVDSKSVGWSDEEGQILRFIKLTNILKMKSYDQEFSLNDLGCGYGSLLTFLDENGFRFCSYNGYEISKPMLEAARKNITEEKASFHLSNLVNKKADYSFASGIFNVKLDVNEEDWLKHTLDTLKNLNDYSTLGFSFNLLTSYVDYKDSNLFYADPAFFFDYCKENFSRFVSLEHDYPLYEWTIHVMKE